jgi:hypothetical protein
MQRYVLIRATGSSNALSARCAHNLRNCYSRGTEKTKGNFRMLFFVSEKAENGIIFIVECKKFNKENDLQKCLLCHTRFSCGIFRDEIITN